MKRVTETQSSLIAFGDRGGGGVVLKIAKSRHSEWSAGEVVHAFAGNGMVRALERAPGACLLEEVSPGTPLVTLVQAGRDTEALEALASVMRRMLEVAPGVEGYPTAMDWASGFDRYLSSDGDSIPVELVRTGRRIYLELCDSQREVRLLHGDLQQYNVLLDQDRGWLAIDPKGVVGEMEFELAAGLRNPHGMPSLYAVHAIERRASHLAQALGADLERILRWTFAQAVLSAIWTVEDGEPWRADSPMLSVAHASRCWVA